MYKLCNYYRIASDDGAPMRYQYCDWVGYHLSSSNGIGLIYYIRFFFLFNFSFNWRKAVCRTGEHHARWSMMMIEDGVMLWTYSVNWYLLVLFLFTFLYLAIAFVVVLGARYLAHTLPDHTFSAHAQQRMIVSTLFCGSMVQSRADHLIYSIWQTMMIISKLITSHRFFALLSM